jgi:PAS domain S-box-containing protein
MDVWLGDTLPYVTMFGACAVAVWYGGYRPALLTSALGFLACNYSFIEPRGTLHIGQARHVIGNLLFFLTCTVIIWFGEQTRRSRRRDEEGRERFQTTLASIGDAVIATDREGRITTMNPVAESLTGWTQADALGQPLGSVFRIVDEGTHQPIDNPVGKVLALGRIMGLGNHTVLVARDGTERPIDDSAAPIRDRQGAVAGCVLIFRDVTERRRANRQARLLASIVEASDDAIIGKDLNGVITSWNRAAERLLGYSADEAIGKPIAILAPPDRAAEMPAILVRVTRGEHIDHFDTIRRARDGRLVPVSLTVSPIRNDAGVIVGASKILRDVSDRKRAEAALQREKARLQATLSGIGDAVIATDAEGRITLMNPVAAALTGWNDEAIGRRLEEVFRIVNETTGQQVESPVARALREGVIVGLANHTILIARDGSRRPIDDSAAPIRDESGTIVGVVLVFRDISGRRLVERRQSEDAARIESIVDNVVDGIVTIDEKGAIQSFNPAAERLFGCSAAEVTGRNVRMLMPELDGGPNDFVGDDRMGREVEGRRKDGSTFPVELAVSEFRFGGQRYFTGIVRDITARKQADASREEADRRKDEFLATLAHELRNPLAPIRNAVQALLIKETVDPGLHWCREVIDRQVRHMARLLDDLLDVSRITHGKLELRKERVDLAAVVQGAVETSRPILDERGQRLVVTLPREPVRLEADPIRLAQVLSNLLNNAAKYSDPGREIRLACALRDGEVLMSVEDQGIGIAPDMLQNIFDIFSQSSAGLDRAQGGLGIGLSLVQGLVELHGGGVEARSDGPGKGSTFVVRLPRAAPEVPRLEPPPRRDGPRVSPRRILIVDDVKDSADSLAMVLQLMGHEVRTAYDGEEGVVAAERFRPEVVLLDLGMPKMNGYDTCRMIRKQPWSQGMLLIAVTGWGQEGDRRATREAGFDHHFVKPVDPVELLGHVERMGRPGPVGPSPHFPSRHGTDARED